MPSISLHPPPLLPLPSQAQPYEETNPLTLLPPLLHTPSGLALVEIQGTLHTPSHAAADASAPASVDDEPSHPSPNITSTVTPMGRLVFPFYSPSATAADDTNDGKSTNSTWMKRVYLYVGKHQRLTGEVKVLAKPLAVVRKRRRRRRREDGDGDDVMQGVDGLGGVGVHGVGDRNADRRASLAGTEEEQEEENVVGEEKEELEIVEIVRYKILFAGRPEPVGD